MNNPTVKCNYGITNEQNISLKLFWEVKISIFSAKNVEILI